MCCCVTAGNVNSYSELALSQIMTGLRLWPSANSSQSPTDVTLLFENDKMDNKVCVKISVEME